MLRIGIAGLGHGELLLQANLPRFEQLPLRVTALCDTDTERLAAKATEFDIAQTTTEFAELVALPDLDIIGIYTPGPLHCEQIVAALEAGKHVMVTKAMVYTMEEAERVVGTVDRTGHVLLVTQSMRGRFDFIDAKRLCDAGEIGDLFMAESHYVHDLRDMYEATPWRWQMPQNLLLGGACHPIDLLRWFLGDVDEVHCYGLRGGVAKKYPQEDNFFINLRFKNGAIGRVSSIHGIVEPGGVPMNSLTVYGTAGTIHDNKIRIDPTGEVPERTYTSTFHTSRSRHHGDGGHEGELVIMMRHMADCVLNGAKPWVGVREGACVVSTGLACWESIRTGQAVKVRNEF